MGIVTTLPFFILLMEIKSNLNLFAFEIDKK